jgi:hypothetical protein
MHDWTQSEESDIPMWVLDLDDASYSVDHRRLCVWQDEFDASWQWDIQMYHDIGAAARGTAASRDEAMTAAEIAARLHARQGGRA